jgi:hypothetical protein
MDSPIGELNLLLARARDVLRAPLELDKRLKQQRDVIFFNKEVVEALVETLSDVITALEES